MQKLKFGIISVLVVGLLGIYLVGASFYTIETGTVGVLSTFGEYSEEEAKPGLHWKIPVVQTVKVVDVKMQTVNVWLWPFRATLRVKSTTLPEISQRMSALSSARRKFQKVCLI